jgi:hypothetical protein
MASSSPSSPKSKISLVSSSILTVVKPEPTTIQTMENRKTWTQSEQTLLDTALKTFPKGSFENKVRWQQIARLTGRSARECAERYQEIRQIVKSKTIHSDLLPETKDIEKATLQEVEPANATVAACVDSISVAPPQSTTYAPNQVPPNSLETQTMEEPIVKGMVVAPTKISKPCRFFASAQGCRSGKLCKFDHDVLAVQVTNNKGKGKGAQKEAATDESAQVEKSHKGKGKGAQKEAATDESAQVEKSHKGKGKGAQKEAATDESAQVEKSHKGKGTQKAITHKVLCRNFQKGTCRHGDSCVFSHLTAAQLSHDVMDEVIEKPGETQPCLYVLSLLECP